MSYFGSVEAMCEGEPFATWGVGPEGEKQAIANCNNDYTNPSGGHYDTKCPTSSPTTLPSQSPTSAYTASPAAAPTTTGCSGEPCSELTQCRSKWGFCGTDVNYCNAEETWSAQCNEGTEEDEEQKATA